MSQFVKALLVLIVGVPLAIMSCGALRPTAPVLAPALETLRTSTGFSPAAQTAAAYRVRTPTAGELEAQATAAAHAAAGTPIAGVAVPQQNPAVGAAQALTPTAPPPEPAAAPLPPQLLPAAALDPAVTRAIDDYLNGQLAAGSFSGAVLVARDGNVVFSKGYGLSDAARGLPNTPQTRFRLASVSKQFTAMAIMMLQAEGRLNVQDPVCGYVPNCPGAWGSITIHHLLTHTSGLPNYTDFGDFGATEAIATTPDELIDRFRDLPLNFQPGELYSYGNSGYVVLGKIVEQVSGEPYDVFLQRRIFEPLGMLNTGYDRDSAGISGRAIGYSSPGIPAAPLDTTTLFAAGGLYSTVDDMFRWDQALAGGALLPSDLQSQMFRPFRNGYAYGWKVDSFFNRTVAFHDGLISGFATCILRFPSDRVTVIVLSNLEYAPAQGYAYDLAGILFGG